MARGFQFRLEVVRRVRKRAQDAQRRVVADSVRAVRKVERRIADLKGDLDRSVRRSRDARMERRVDVFSLRGHQMFQASVHRHLLEAVGEMSQRQGELDTERAKLAEVANRLKAIEKLREKRWAEYVKGLEKRERAAYDEAATSRFIRQLHSARLERMAT